MVPHICLDPAVAAGRQDGIAEDRDRADAAAVRLLEDGSMDGGLG